MAEDWIKMRTDLYRDPKVCMMADLLMAGGSESEKKSRYIMCNGSNVTRNVFRNAVVGGLVAVWGTFRHKGKRDGDNLIATYVYLDIIDDIAEFPGFGAAMSLVGWLKIEQETLIFPNFFKDYNSEAKPLSLAKSNAQRQAEYRARKAVSDENIDPKKRVTKVTLRNDREEKRREENNTPPKPPVGGGGEFEKFWQAYPKKSGKKSALAAWAELDPSPELLARILEDLEARCQSEAWTSEDGRWVPKAENYILDERWNDEATTNKPKKKKLTQEQISDAIKRQEEYLRQRSRNGEKVQPGSGHCGDGTEIPGDS